MIFPDGQAITGRLITLVCSRISVWALALSTTAAWTAVSSLRQVVPLRLSTTSQPQALSQPSSLAPEHAPAVRPLSASPKGLPAEVVTRVNTAANQVLKDPEVIDKLTRLGIEPVGGTPAQFTAMLGTELAKWKKIIQERKITLD